MNYKVQRHDERTLITTAGEVRFRNTLYLREEDGKYEHLLSRMMCLRDKERLSEGAEAELIKEAIKTSYERASLVLPLKGGLNRQKIDDIIKTQKEQLPQGVDLIRVVRKPPLTRSKYKGGFLMP